MINITNEGLIYLIKIIYFCSNSDVSKLSMFVEVAAGIELFFDLTAI